MSSSWICFDASIVIRLLVGVQDQGLKQQFQQWEASHRLAAPTLLFYEVTNALYQYQRHGVHSPAVTQSALLSAQSLPIQLFGDQHLHQQALQLTEQHSLSATYDAPLFGACSKVGRGAVDNRQKARKRRQGKVEVGRAVDMKKLRLHKTLPRKFGPVGMVRFLQQYATGHGDYTAEREAWQNKLEEEAFLEQVVKQEAR